MVTKRDDLITQKKTGKKERERASSQCASHLGFPGLVPGLVVEIPKKGSSSLASLGITAGLLDAADKAVQPE